MRRIRRRLMRTYANLDIPIEWQDDAVKAWADKSKIITRRDCKAKTSLDEFRDVAPRARYFMEARWFDNVRSIGYGQFQFCDIVKVLLPDSIESFDGGWEFRQCYNLRAIGDLPRLTAISSHCFHACTSLALKELPENLTEIGDGAFYGCTSLALTSLPDSVTTIGSWAFYGCTSLALKELPDSVTTIGDKTFYGCTSLALKELPDSVTTIGSWAFYGCTSLALKELPDSVATIGDEAFYGCTSLALTSLPDSVTTIGDEAFYGCTSLALTSLPDSVTTIGSWAFRDDTAITIRDIPDSVATIGDEAFRSCTKLGKIKVWPRQPPTAGSSIFLGCPEVQLYVPDDAVDTYKAASGWSGYADRIHPLSEWVDE